MGLNRQQKLAWGFLAPTLIILGVIGVFPFIYALYLSFFDWNIFSKAGKMIWTGANNYRKLVFDAAFWDSFLKGVKLLVWTVPIEIVLGLFLATSLNKPYRGRNFFRLIIALPLTMAPIAIGAIWKLMTMPGMGIIPQLLYSIGIDYNMGNSAQQAFATVVLMDIWHWTPFVTLALLAGLTSLPKEPFEQAQIDGANKAQAFFYLTLPMLRPVITTILFIRIMDVLRIVDEVWMLTGGGPGTATRFVGIHIWRVVFPKTDYGYGSAISIILLYITIVLSWLLFTAISKGGREEV